MRLTDRISSRLEQRTIGGVPWLPFVPFGQGGPVHPSKYHIGQEHALRLSPLYGAVKLLADGVASLPLKIYRNVDGKKLLWTGPSIFDQPAPTGTYYDWMHQGMLSLLLHGNALGYIVSRDGFGFPQQIIWLPPEHCDIIDDETQDFANPVKARYFYFGRQLDPADLLHVRAMSMAGHTAALSPLGAYKALIEGGLDQQEYSKLWFANGGFPPGVFKNNELEVDADVSRAIRGTLTETLRRRQPLVIGRDWDYTPISVKPEEAQFVETTRLTATQIAAIYQVPPEMIGGSRGDSMTYSSQEQNTNNLIVWSLRPWLRRWENAFFSILPQARYVKFDVDDLVRVDQATRYANYKIARDSGWMLADEIRDTEDRPPLKGGIGQETLGGDVLVSMSRGIGVLPKSFAAQVVAPQEAVPGFEPKGVATPPQPAALPPGEAKPGEPKPGEPPAAPESPQEGEKAPADTDDDGNRLWASQALMALRSRAEPGTPAIVKPEVMVPPGTPPPRRDMRDGESLYSVDEIARQCFGPLAAKQEYLDLVSGAARDAGYAVGSARAETFSREQADWIAADSLRRPRPIERFELNGHDRQAARHG